MVAGDSGPSSVEMVSAVMVRASGSVALVNFTVSNDAQAMAVVQPWHRKRASVMRWFFTRAERCRMSPQTGLVTSTVAVALGSWPTLRGDWKWSRTASLNMDFSIAKQGGLSQMWRDIADWECAVR